MVKILVTGANGFVGSHIVEKLVENGVNVFCLVRKTSNLRWLEGLPLKYIFADFDAESSLGDAVKNMDFVVHCAGAVRARTKQDYFKVNCQNTVNLCNAILKCGVNLKKFIFMSSQAAQGGSSAKFLRKLSDKEEPVSDYGISKLAAENEIRTLLTGKIPYTILRPASVYGPRDKDIFILFNLVKKHLKLFTVSKRYLQVVFVKDVVNVVDSCLKNSKTDGKTYYLADGEFYTWKKIAEIIAKVQDIKTIPVPLPDFVFKFVSFAAEFLAMFGKKTPVLNKQKIIEMLQYSWSADITLVKKDLNVSFTPFEIGSKVTYNWYADNKYF
jgi:nucleoside-diphosphate-sugar epimerase